jgi:hypothetical protein
VAGPGRVEKDKPTRGGEDHRAEAIAFCDAFPNNKVKNQEPIPRRSSARSR